MKILLVEDDFNLSNDIKHQLLLEKFEVDTAYDGILAERLITIDDSLYDLGWWKGIFIQKIKGASGYIIEIERAP